MKTVREEVLARLLLGEALRGEEFALQLSVTRAAVWKAVQELRAEGVPIVADRARGYCIPKGADVLCQETVQEALPGHALQWHECIDSTNLQARRWAQAGAPHGAVVVACAQTGGRGRLGRHFESPKGGIYFSIILRPKSQKQGLSLLTAAAAVAVCRSVQTLCGIRLQIKWVNDLFWENKKCAGILTEAMSNLESGGFEHLICGIGINYALPPEALPEELADIATSLYGPNSAPCPRAVLLGEIVQAFMGLYEALPNRDFLGEYRERNFVPGKRVWVLQGEGYEAEALAIDDEARLQVCLADGEIRTLNSGEVSIRPVSGREKTKI